MARFAYNPITSQLDMVDSAASFIGGVVADPSLLPVTPDSPAIHSVYLAKTGTGVWNHKPAGLYLRVANNSDPADWSHIG